MTENVKRLTYQAIKRKDRNDRQIEYKEAVLVNGTTHKVPMNEDFIYVQVSETALIKNARNALSITRNYCWVN